MNPRSLILLALAGVGVLLVVMLTRSYLSGLEQRSQRAEVVTKEVPTAKILVAKSNLPAGTFFQAEQVEFRTWPKEGVSDTYYSTPKDKITDLKGMVVRTPIRAGEPVTRAAMVAHGDKGFMAAILSAGMRAVAVKLSPTSGVAGFIFPGDRVDVILTQSIEVPGTRVPYIVSETVFQNVRVLGMDQTSKPAGDQAKASAQIAKTATLEVTPKMAEKVAMLEKLGTLSLSLRSLAAGNDGLGSDPTSPPVSVTTTHTLGSEVSSFRQTLDEEEKGGTIVVKRGSDASVVSLDGKKKEPGK
ncbi:MAG: Flp pilus assembly protein CpaB [Alphaproteobacteria bacterium]|nr:Flp pilus assembly protein CpaB [Alphaproteobacteria bacterium]